MKHACIISILLLLFTFSMPLLSVSGNPAVSPDPANLRPAQSSSPALSASGDNPGNTDAHILVRVLDEGVVKSMPMDQYLRCVLAAEMPASFQPEALKAQAVAARTYTLYRIQSGTEKHPEADVCTDHLCCAAYTEESEAAAAWGDLASLYWEKITAAVADTDGMVALYDGQLIDTVFHSSSGGHTETAKNVWGTDLPYLRSVETPENNNSVPNYYSIVEVPVSRFKTIFLEKYPGADLSGAPAGWFKNEKRSEAGNVSSIEIGGISASGAVVRSLFGLRSAMFQIEADADTVIFRVTGYGHGVGMSQYGANVMAAQGSNYIEILQWYYTGITVESWQG